ncbi:MAG: hypothetical protein NT162_03630 [Candidatus Woesebacteria bacterium]|nr:hypothetical protein [Candidatus Woesebacteria bacterium]
MALKERIKVVCWTCKAHVYNWIGEYPQATDRVASSNLEPANTLVPKPFDTMLIKCPFCGAVGLHLFMQYPWSFQKEAYDDFVFPLWEAGSIFKYLEVNL